MKNLTLLSVLCMALLFFACTKKSDDTNTTPKTYFEADANGAKVTGDISSKKFKEFDGGDDSTAVIATIAGQSGVSLEMHFKEPGLGTYNVVGGQVRLITRAANGDITKQYFGKVINSNKVIITNVDASSNIITGTFNFSLEDGSFIGDNPDSVVFTNGKFAVKLP